MRKSLIIYLLLLPLLLASSVQVAAAMSDIDSSSPWSSPVTATSIGDDDNGVSVGNLFTAAPRFDSVASCIVPTLGLADWTQQDAHRWDRSPIFTLNQRLLI